MCGASLRLPRSRCDGALLRFIALLPVSFRNLGEKSIALATPVTDLERIVLIAIAQINNGIWRVPSPQLPTRACA